MSYVDSSVDSLYNGLSFKLSVKEEGLVCTFSLVVEKKRNFLEREDTAYQRPSIQWGNDRL
jgi:hypothetical protein